MCLPTNLCCIRDKLKQDIARLENEKTDLGLELSFVRDKLQQKTAAADNLEIEALELGAKLDKSTRDYVRAELCEVTCFCVCTLCFIIGTKCMFVTVKSPRYSTGCIQQIHCLYSLSAVCHRYHTSVYILRLTFWSTRRCSSRALRGVCIAYSSRSKCSRLS